MKNRKNHCLNSTDNKYNFNCCWHNRTFAICCSKHYFENSYLDILLVFAIPFGIGIVYYILIIKTLKRWLKINLLMRILLKTIF